MRSSARLKSISLLKESISHLNLESKAGARLDRKCVNVGGGAAPGGRPPAPGCGRESSPSQSLLSNVCVGNE